MPGEKITLKELSRHLKTKARDDYRALREEIDEQVRNGVLDRDENGRISYVAGRNKGRRPQSYVGRYTVSRREGGMVEVEGLGTPVSIAPRFAHTAVHGDLVEVVPFARSARRRTRLDEERIEGEIVAIVTRGRTDIAGTLNMGKRFAFVVPDDDRFPRDIYVPADDARKAKDGDKVVVALQPWEDEHQSPEGTITEVLGPAGDARVEVLSVARSFGLTPAFPADVNTEASALPDSIAREELAHRLDLRETACFTIDPDDAKDFDDAVSLQRTRNGWRLGVHIADVSHFVREGTALDREALSRGTSVYLVNEVIPMLPERLSNGLCSLKPDEDRLTYSVMMDLDPAGTVLDYSITRSIIHSKRRYTYEEVQRVLDGGRDPHGNDLRHLWAVAEVQLKKRRKNGSIDFDTGEKKFLFDAAGLPTQIIRKARLNAHRLIEECMLLANRVVAAHVGSKKKEDAVRPFLYRVHDLPDQARLADLANFVKQFGYSLDAKNGVSSRELQKLLSKVEGTEVENVINGVALRAMAKAVYSDRNIGHYGLAFTHYTHFTSPIRRYPDLIVHRLLTKYAADIAPAKVDAIRRELPGIARQSSERERQAMEAERMSVRVMQAEYMKRHVGDEFDGVIVGVTKFGLFVELKDLLVEGLVHISDLSDDYYLLDEKHYSLRGRSSGRTFRLGDNIRVSVMAVNAEEHQIQFLLA